MELLVPPDSSGFDADPGTSPTLLPGARSSGKCNNPSPVVRFVSLRAGGGAELPLIPVCQKALVDINTVVLVEVPGSRDEIQAASFHGDALAAAVGRGRAGSLFSGILQCWGGCGWEG